MQKPVTEKKKYFVVRERAVPEVLLKVVEEGPPYAAFIFCADAPAALLETVRSRCALLKYDGEDAPLSDGTAELCRAFHEETRGKTITFIIQMDDEPGLLSVVLQTIARFHGNILTIHQSIPINGIATLTLSVDILPGEGDAEAMVETIEQNEGIHYLKILGRE